MSPKSAILTPEAATRFAAEWIEAWNARDLDRILKHYAREVVFTSPLVSQFLSCNQSTLRGLAALRIYFTRALNAYPDLQFTLRRVYLGARSLALEYQSVSHRLAAEMMEFNDAGLIVSVSAHYSAANLKPNA
jgi:hypothetical protein